MVSVEPVRSPINPVRARAALAALNLLMRAAHGSFSLKGVRLRVAAGCFAPIFVSTGLLCDAALRTLKGAGLGCEVGTGPGSIAMVLAKNLNAEVVGTDVDLKCLKCARENARRNEVYHLFHPVACRDAQALRDQAFTFAVVNPPYLPLEPRGAAGLAACGGRELEVLNQMLRDCIRVLKLGGVLLFTASSLARVKGAKLVGQRWALFDTVRAYLHIRLRSSLGPRRRRILTHH